MWMCVCRLWVVIWMYVRSCVCASLTCDTRHIVVSVITRLKIVCRYVDDGVWYGFWELGSASNLQSRLNASTANKEMLNFIRISLSYFCPVSIHSFISGMYLRKVLNHLWRKYKRHAYPYFSVTTHVKKDQTLFIL